MILVILKIKSINALKYLITFDFSPNFSPILLPITINRNPIITDKTVERIICSEPKQNPVVKASTERTKESPIASLKEITPDKSLSADKSLSSPKAHHSDIHKSVTPPKIRKKSGGITPEAASYKDSDKKRKNAPTRLITVADKNGIFIFLEPKDTAAAKISRQTANTRNAEDSIKSTPNLLCYILCHT